MCAHTKGVLVCTCTRRRKYGNEYRVLRHMWEWGERGVNVAHGSIEPNQLGPWFVPQIYSPLKRGGLFSSSNASGTSPLWAIKGRGVLTKCFFSPFSFGFRCSLSSLSLVLSHAPLLHLLCRASHAALLHKATHCGGTRPPFTVMSPSAHCSEACLGSVSTYIRYCEIENLPFAWW